MASLANFFLFEGEFKQAGCLFSIREFNPLQVSGRNPTPVTEELPTRRTGDNEGDI
jgi:hypothetical protein